MHKVLAEFDAFSEPLPAFNIKGHTSVHTLTGGVMTILLFGVVLVYAVSKLIDLQSKYNPSMSTYTVKDYFSDEDRFDLTASDFRVALSYESFMTKEFKNDPRYIQWHMRVYGRRDGVDYEY